MIRKLKTVGLVVLAVLALQSLTATGAQAEFKSSSTHTLLSLTQSTFHELAAAPGTGAIRCNITGGNGTLSAATNEDLNLVPEIVFCQDTFGRAVFAHGTMRYTFTTDGTLHRTGDATYTIVGNGGTVVCTITLVAQSNSGVTYNNLGGTKGVEVTTNQTNLVTTVTGGFFNCGVKNGEYKEGTYTGTSILTGKDTAGNPVELNKLP